MSGKNSCTVRFVTVKTNLEKQNKLCQLVFTAYAKRKKILIIVPSKEAAAYVDQLLWKQPEESFMPHAIVDRMCSEPIAITTQNSNLNGAEAVINLSPNTLSSLPSIGIIYELNDLTSPEKEALSSQKRNAYAASGFPMEDL